MQANKAALPVRARPHQRQARVADRGAAGAAIDRARRALVADAAVSHQAAAFDLQGVTDADLIDYTPELKARAREIAKDYVIGPCSRRPRSRATSRAARKARWCSPARGGRRTGTPAPSIPRPGSTTRSPQTLGPANRSARQTGERRCMEYDRSEYAGIGRAAVASGCTAQRRRRRRRPWTRSASTGCRSSRARTVGSPRSISTPANHVWTVANGDGPRHHPLLKGLNLPPLGDPEPAGAARHQDAAVPRRGQQCGERHVADVDGPGARSSAPTTRRPAG